MLYFCGFTDPDAVLLVRVDPLANDGHHATLVVAARNAVSVKWNGPVVTADKAVGLYGVDASETLNELNALIDAEILASSTVYLDVQKAHPATTRHAVQQRVEEVLSGGHRAVSPLSRNVDALKAIKSPAEVALMEKACEQATCAFHDAMEASRADINEHQLAALVEYGECCVVRACV
jgi:Xaa-Pro aminopeptidase